MRRVLLALVLLVACDQLQTWPTPRDPALMHSTDAGHGPPKPEKFGEDTYRIGAFTGQGITTPGLDCVESSREWRTCAGFLPSRVDGALLDVSVAIPHGAGPHPLVVLIHGYAGSKSSSGDIAVRLLTEGYAVLRYSTRGFGRSWGQVNLVDVHAEVEDLRSIVGQVIDHRGFRLNAEAVAVTGASYGGGHSWLALLEPTWTSPKGTPVHIKTVVPIVPWSDLLYSLLPNGRERRSVDHPGGLKLSYVNGLYVSGLRESEERPYPNYPEYFMGWHAWLNKMEPMEFDPVFQSIEDGLAGYRSIWWQEEFWKRIAARRIPIFQVQGFTDDLFPLPEAARMLRALRTLDPTYPIATYLGDIGHPRASNKPGEMEYVLDLTSAWLAHYLKGEGSAPPNVIHAAITRPRDELFDPANVITVESLDQLASTSLSKAFDATAELVNPVADPLAGFAWDPLVMEAAREMRPYRLPAPPSAVDPLSLAVYEVPVTELTGGTPALIAGQPRISLHASTFAHRVQLNVRLFDVAPDGSRSLITRGTYTIDSGALEQPIGDVPIVIPTYGNLWSIAARHVLRLEITNLDSPYITPSRVPSKTTISEVRLEIPVR